MPELNQAAANILAAIQLAVDDRLDEVAALVSGIWQEGTQEAFVFLRGLTIPLAATLRNDPSFVVPPSDGTPGVDSALDILTRQRNLDETGSQFAAFLLVQSQGQVWAQGCMFLLAGLAAAVATDRIARPALRVTVTTQNPGSN
jgi:hypothetical protein